MAKVMVSLPDDLPSALDAQARGRGTTRSGILRAMAEESLRRGSLVRANRMAEIDAEVVDRRGHGGNVAALVKASR